MCCDVLLSLSLLAPISASARPPIRCNYLTFTLKNLLVRGAQDHLSLKFSCWLQSRRERAAVCLSLMNCGLWLQITQHIDLSWQTARFSCLKNRELKQGLTFFYLCIRERGVGQSGAHLMNSTILRGQMYCNVSLGAWAVLSHSPQKGILQIKRPLKTAHLHAAAFQHSACIACGYVPIKPAADLSTNSSHADLMPKSDSDRTWGRFRQGRFGSPEFVL